VSTTSTVRPAESQPAPQITIRLAHDPLRAEHGYRIDSAYVETFWLSHLGPSAVCVLRLVARTAEPDAITIPLTALGAACGIPGSGAKHSVIGRTLDRLIRFGAAQWVGGDRTSLRIWSHLGPVPLSLQQKWPDWLQAEHDQAVEAGTGR
jgi:hypothetical protein